MLNIGKNCQVFIQIKYKKELKFFHLKIYGTNLVPKKFQLTLIEGNIYLNKSIAEKNIQFQLDVDLS